MSKEKRTYIYHAVFYNCLMLAAAIVSFAVSLWLAVSGRLGSEGVDAVFLFAVGLTTGSVFVSVPVISIREGLLRDVRELLDEASRRAPEAKSRPQRAWQESPAH